MNASRNALGIVIGLVCALGLAEAEAKTLEWKDASAAVPLAKAKVGDWMEIEWSQKYSGAGLGGPAKEVRQVWAVHALLPGVVVIEIKETTGSRYLSLPRAERLSAPLLELIMKNELPTTHKPPTRARAWEPRATKHHGTCRVQEGRKTKLTLKHSASTRTARKVYRSSELTKLEIDPEGALIGMTSGTYSMSSNMNSGRKISWKLLRVGAPGEAAPRPEWVDPPKFKKLVTEADPFAGLEVGKSAVFRAKLHSRRPIQRGDTVLKARFRVEVQDARTLVYTKLDGDRISARETYTVTIPELEAKARRIYLYGRSFLPMVEGGGRLPVASASMSGSAVKKVKIKRKKGTHTETFELELDANSPVGFARVYTKILNFKGSWDTLELEIER